MIALDLGNFFIILYITMNSNTISIVRYSNGALVSKQRENDRVWRSKNVQKIRRRQVLYKLRMGITKKPTCKSIVKYELKFERNKGWYWSCTYSATMGVAKKITFIVSPIVNKQNFLSAPIKMNPQIWKPWKIQKCKFYNNHSSFLCQLCLK